VLSEVKSFGSFRFDTVNDCHWRDAERISITAVPHWLRPNFPPSREGIRIDSSL
jgi:hypothetical protein